MRSVHHPGDAIRRQIVTAIAVLAVVIGGCTGRATANVDRPTYARGDAWTYRTNLTESLNLSFEGSTTLEAGDVAGRTVQGLVVDALELYLSGGGTFGGAFPGFGDVRGNWTVDGFDWWEARAWKPVRSSLRLVAAGELRTGPTTVPVTFELRNETTQRIATDGWPWPIATGTTGAMSSVWNATENLTVQFGGNPPQSNESAVEGTFSTIYADLRAERTVVPAGTFDAEVIRETRPDGGHTLRWYSGRVGNDVRIEEYNETGTRISRSELAAYRYAAGEPAPAFPWLPVVIAALAVVVVVLAVALARRSRGRRRPVETWMPPEPEAPPGPPRSP